MRYADGITEVLLPIQAEAHQHGIRLRLRAMWMDGTNMADNSNTKSIPRDVILLQVNVISSVSIAFGSLRPLSLAPTSTI